MLLDTLLCKAIESESSLEKYTPICIALFHEPLEIAIPASYSTLLLRLLERAMNGLSYKTIRPVYQTFSNLGSSNLSALPTELLLRLQDSLITVLRSSDVEEVSTSLISLALLARLASWPGPFPTLGSSAQTSDVDASTTIQTLLRARHFFSAEKAYKIMDLVVLKAIMLCSDSCTLKSHEAIESLKLCAESVQAIESRERSSWVTKNSGKLKKLGKKVLRADINNEVQWVALQFLIFLVGEQSLPHEVVGTIETLMPLQALLIQHKGLLNDVAMGRIFCSLLEQASKATSPSMDSLIKLDNALKIAEHFAKTMTEPPKLAQTVARAVSSREGQALLHCFVAQTEAPPVDPKFEPLHICLCEFRETRLQLRNKITAILLSAGLCCSGQGEEAFRSTLFPLLDLEGKPAQVSCTNKFLRRKGAPVSLLETGSTPQTTSISHGWKDKIAKEMSRDAHYRSESLVRMAGEICRDLELRCEDTERPLRAEQSRSRDLEAKLETSMARIRELEADNEHSRFQMKDFEQEKQSLLEQIRSSEHHLQDLSRKVDKIHKEFQHVKADAQRSIETAAECARQQDLAYLATMTGKDEMYEEQASKLAASERRVQDLEKILAQLQSQEVRMADKAKEDDESIEELETSLSRLRNLLESKEAEIERLLKSETNLLATIDNRSQQAEEAAKEHDAIVSGLKSNILAADAETMQLREEHCHEITERAATSSRLEEQVRLTVNNMTAELQQIRSEAARTVEARDATIVELQIKVAISRQERQARAREFAEAQDLSSKLMAIVGTKQPPRALTLARKASSSRNTGFVSDDWDSVACRGFQEVKDARTRDSISATLSKDRGSPLPKRARIQRSVTSPLTPSVDTLKFGAELGAWDGKRRAKRAPLTHLTSEPASHRKSVAFRQSKGPEKTTTAFHQASEGKDENNDQRVESDESFGDADIFTSADQQQFLASHKDVLPSTYDERTQVSDTFKA